MVKANAATATETQTKTDGNSHDTVQEIVVWNDKQVAVVSPDAAGTQLSLVADLGAERYDWHRLHGRCRTGWGW